MMQWILQKYPLTQHCEGRGIVPFIKLLILCGMNAGAREPTLSRGMSPNIKKKTYLLEAGDSLKFENYLSENFSKTKKQSFKKVDN